MCRNARGAHRRGIVPHCCITAYFGSISALTRNGPHVHGNPPMRAKRRFEEVEPDDIQNSEALLRVCSLAFSAALGSLQSLSAALSVCSLETTSLSRTVHRLAHSLSEYGSEWLISGGPAEQTRKHWGKRVPEPCLILPSRHVARSLD
jgi:hypothetical protein